MIGSRSPAGGAGSPQATPWVGVLLRLLDERWNGTLLLQDENGEPLAILRLEAGQAMAGLMEGSGSLLERLIPLCDRADARVVLVDGIDLLESAQEVTLGSIDPVRLMMIAMRGQVREDVVDQAMAAIGQDLLKLNPRTNLDRYGFEAAEQQAIADLAHAPATLDQLRQRSQLSERALYRVVYTLLTTRGITQVPSWRRIVSGAVLHALPPPAPAEPPEPPRNDEPTRVMRIASTRSSDVHPRVQPISVPPRQSAPYKLHEPAHGSETIPPQRDAGDPSPMWSSPPLDPDAHFRAAELLLERGNCRGAVLEAQKAMRQCPPRPEQRALYAWLLYRRHGDGEPVQDCVWEHLEEALQEDPDCALAHYFKGVLLKRSGDLEQGRHHLERALDLESEE